MFTRDTTYFAIRRSTLTGLAAVLLVALGTAGLPPSRAGGEMDIRVDQARFHVEIAETVQERQQGLMFRTHLVDSHGMLFIQSEAAPVAFWMKNTYIPLDLLYFDTAGRLLEVHAGVPPCITPSCPLYVSKGPVKYVLELNAGSARQLGLQPGAQLHLHE